MLKQFGNTLRPHVRSSCPRRQHPMSVGIFLFRTKETRMGQKTEAGEKHSVASRVTAELRELADRQEKLTDRMGLLLESVMSPPCPNAPVDSDYEALPPLFEELRLITQRLRSGMDSIEAMLDRTAL